MYKALRGMTISLLTFATFSGKERSGEYEKRRGSLFVEDSLLFIIS